MLKLIVLFFLTFNAYADEWRFSRTKENSSQFARENNASFWASFQRENSPYLKFQGFVFGDAHLGNFSVRNWEGKKELRFDDFDDVGEGPFVVDFIRFLSTSSLYGITDQKSLIAHYIKGLEGDLDHLALEISKEDRNENQLDHSKNSITKDQWLKIETALQLKIEEIVTYTPKDGGSQNLKRYWFIADGKLLELKPLANPSPSYLATQLNDEERINKAKKTIWDDEKSIYPKVIHLDGENFLLRERNSKLSTNKEIRNAKTALYIANMIGFVHGKQISAKAYLEEIKNNPKEFESFLIKNSAQKNTIMNYQMKEVLAQNNPLRFGGSIRYRLQKQKEDKQESKIQHKFRLRLDTEVRKSGGLRGFVRLETNQDATSGHENLNDTFNKKNIFISQVFIEKSFGQHINLQIGKMPAPFLTVGESEIIWDESINPEGASLKLQKDSFFFNAGAYLLLNNYDSNLGKDLNDNRIYALQLGINHKWRDLSFVLAMGSTKFTDLKGEKFNTVGKKSGHGNSDGGKNTFAFDYHILDASFEIKFFDIALFTHLTRNTKAEKEREAYRLGVHYKLNDFKILFAHTRLEKDSTLGAITNSSPASGGTNISYNEVGMGYDLYRDLELKLTHFWSKELEDSSIKYKKLRVDLTLSF